MTNHWLEALKLWNDDKIYTIPKKGTKEYLEVKKLMEALKKKEKKQGDGVILSSLKPVGEFIKQNLSYFNGRYFIMPHVFRLWLKAYYPVEITSITVCRTPLRGPIANLINFFSRGKFKKNISKSQYDTLFHLYIVIEFSDMKKFRIERNQRLSVSDGSVVRGIGTECIPIQMNKMMTLSDLFENYKNIVGSFDKMIEYDASSNNCQKFIHGLLNSSGLLNDTTSKFILQDMVEIFKGMQKTNNAIGAIVDLAVVIDLIRGV